MCQAVLTAAIAADADREAYLRDMTEAYPWETPTMEADPVAEAAPQMLAALELVLQKIQACNDQEFWMHFRPARLAAEAAIKAAKGN